MKRLLLLALTLVTLIATTIPMAVPVLACEGIGEEGLTPGYWKNHLDAWHVYSPGDGFDAVFGTTAFAGTLQEALNLRGGGLNALARHAVAALLNLADPDISYCYANNAEGLAELIDRVQAAIADGEYEGLKDELDICNNYGVDGDD